MGQRATQGSAKNRNSADPSAVAIPGFRITRSRAIHRSPDLSSPVILTNHERP